jgi:hypothetical protein
MSRLSTIPANDHNYVGEFLEDLPNNCYFNKVLTGCGGTTVALTNNVNYVICVPFISLIQNKLDQVENAFGFYGGIKTEDLQSYLANTDVTVKKILVTYDSLAKLIEYINPQEYKLLIDEAHKLLDSASFRFKAVKSVMQNYEKFNSYVFMTATPVQDKYQLPELASLPKVEIDWGDIVPVNLSKVKANTPTELYDYTILTAIKYLDGDLEGTPYFFMNSVKKITDLVKKLKDLGKVTENQVKIICADTEENRLEIKKKTGWSLDKASTESKKINFCTSTAFEGSDIYCEDGVTYIISDGFRTHTKYDILTTIPQIVGRIRNSVYKNKVNLFYYDSPYYNYVSPEEYEVYVKKELDASKKLVEDYDNFVLERDSEDKLIKSIQYFAITDPYIYSEDETVEVALWAWHNEMHNYEVVNTNYSVRLQGTEVVNKTPYQYSDKEIKLDGLNGLSKLRIGKVPNFCEICKEYLKLQGTKLKTKETKDTIKSIEIGYPCIKTVYEKLGEEAFTRTRYSKKKLEVELTKLNSVKDPNIVREFLKLEVGKKYSREDLKLKILSLPVDYQPAKKTANSIEDFYSVRKTQITRDGKVVNGYIILGIK